MSTKKILLTIAILSCCMSSQAQARFGIKGGLSASWIPGTVINGDEVVSPHNSFYAGGFANWELGDILLLQTELLYAGKGHSDRSRLLNEKYFRDLGYLQLPVFVGVRIADDRCGIMLGPELGYLVYANTRDYDGSRKDSRDECNPFNFAIALQAAYMITDGLGIEIKADWGLTRTFKGAYLGVADDPGHNMSFQIGLCYRFED